MWGEGATSTGVAARIPRKAGVCAWTRDSPGPAVSQAPPPGLGRRWNSQSSLHNPWEEGPTGLLRMPGEEVAPSGRQGRVSDAGVPPIRNVSQQSCVCVCVCVCTCARAQLLQSCLTLCNPMDYPPGSSVHGDFPGKSNGVGHHFLFQGIFLTQGSNQCLFFFFLCLYLSIWVRSQHSVYLLN